MENGSRAGKRASFRASAFPSLNSRICAMGRGARLPDRGWRLAPTGGPRQRLRSRRGLLAPGAARARPRTHSPPGDPGLSPAKAPRRCRPSAAHREPSDGSPTPSPTSRASSPRGASRGGGPAGRPPREWGGGPAPSPFAPRGRLRRGSGVGGPARLGTPRRRPFVRAAGRAGPLTACAGGSAAAAAAARPGARGAGPRTWRGGGPAGEVRRRAGSGALRCLSAQPPSFPARRQL